MAGVAALLYGILSFYTGDSKFIVSKLVKTLMELIFNPCGEFR